MRDGRDGETGAGGQRRETERETEREGGAREREGGRERRKRTHTLSLFLTHSLTHHGCALEVGRFAVVAFFFLLLFPRGLFCVVLIGYDAQQISTTTAVPLFPSVASFFPFSSFFFPFAFFLSFFFFFFFFAFCFCALWFPKAFISSAVLSPLLSSSVVRVCLVVACPFGTTSHVRQGVPCCGRGRCVCRCGPVPGWLLPSALQPLHSSNR